MTKKESTKDKKTRRKNPVTGVLRGRMLSTDFLRRYKVAIALTMLFALSFIYVRYECLTSMETIQRLEKELEVANTERLREKSRYMSNTRERAMNERLRRAGIKIEVSTRPPYKL